MAFAFQRLGTVAVVGAPGKFDALRTVGACPTRKTTEKSAKERFLNMDGQTFVLNSHLKIIHPKK